VKLRIIATCFIAACADPCNKIKLFCKFAVPLFAESTSSSTTEVAKSQVVAFCSFIAKCAPGLRETDGVFTMVF